MSSDAKPRAGLGAILGILIVAGLVAAAVIVPRQQSPRLQAEGEIQVYLEKGRRLLAQYDSHLSIESGYRAAFGEEAFGLAADRLEDLVDDPDLDLTGLASDALRSYANRPEIKNMARADDEFLKLMYGEANWREHKDPPPPSRVSGAAMIDRGNAAYEKELAGNARLLERALSEVSAALAVSLGDYSARQHGGAHRLAGVIHSEQGLAVSRRLRLLCGELAQRRFAMKRRQSEILKILQDQDLVAGSEIDARIAEARSEEAKMAATVTEQQATVARLQDQVENLEQGVDAALGRSAAAREAMETLEDMGVDLSVPSGFAEFKRTYEQQAEDYRQALTEAHVLQHGTLKNATIDETGDYLRGRYIPAQQGRDIELQHGLEHYQHDLERAQAELEKMEEAAAHLEESVENLRGLKRNLEERAQLARDAAATRTTQLETDFEGFAELEERIAEAEDEAIALFEKAIQSFATAVLGVSADENLAQAGRPNDPQRQAYHYSHLAGNQGWLKGQLAAQQADAELLIGIVLIGRYQDAKANVEDLGKSALAQDQVEAWRETIDETKAAAVERVESAIDGLTNKAKNQIGDGNWTVAAEIGAAYYLLSLLDVPLAAETAVEWYKLVVEGREAVAGQHQYMLNHIERRLSAGN
ncbi:MAG: hypothetical protein IH895_01835 [Planctomycetes bacterium]|nr:hypothetical protein [Planctomycetota bacterium]